MTFRVRLFMCWNELGDVFHRNYRRTLSHFVECIRISKFVTRAVPLASKKKPGLLYFQPPQARDILARPELAALKINADLSHWCCVCEKVLACRLRISRSA